MMPKRFTTSDKWEKPWFRALTPRLKCFWDYLYTRCDAAGIWDADYVLASVYVGEPVTQDDLKAYGDRAEILPDGKVWLTTFCSFQYGELSETCVPHKKVIERLRVAGLLSRLKSSVRGRVLSTLQEEDKEEDKDKKEEKEPSRPRAKSLHLNPPTLEDCRAAAVTIGMRDSDIVDCFNHHEGTGWMRAGQPLVKLSAVLATWKGNIGKYDRHAPRPKTNADGLKMNPMTGRPYDDQT